MTRELRFWAWLNLYINNLKDIRATIVVPLRLYLKRLTVIRSRKQTGPDSLVSILKTVAILWLIVVRGDLGDPIANGNG